jgi:hypothetical protein
MAHTTGSSVYFDGHGSNRSTPDSSLTWNNMTRLLRRLTPKFSGGGRAE